jgi:hypothetical protein
VPFLLAIPLLDDGNFVLPYGGKIVSCNGRIFDYLDEMG